MLQDGSYLAELLISKGYEVSAYIYIYICVCVSPTPRQSGKVAQKSLTHIKLWDSVQIIKNDSIQPHCNVSVQNLVYWKGKGEGKTC